MKGQTTTLATTLLMLILSGCATYPPVSNHTPIAPVPASTQVNPPISSFAQKSQLGFALSDLENTTARTFTTRLLPRFGGETLRVGDIFDIDLYSSTDAYLHLYLFQSSGTVMALTENLRVRAGQTVAFPPVNANYRMRAHPPTGNNTFLLLATQRPIPGTIRHNYQYLSQPRRIIANQNDAINTIRKQLRDVPITEWQSAIHDIAVYR